MLSKFQNSIVKISNPMSKFKIQCQNFKSNVKILKPISEFENPNDGNVDTSIHQLGYYLSRYSSSCMSNQVKVQQYYQHLMTTNHWGDGSVVKMEKHCKFYNTTELPNRAEECLLVENYNNHHANDFVTFGLIYMYCHMFLF